MPDTRKLNSHARINRFERFFIIFPYRWCVVLNRSIFDSRVNPKRKVAFENLLLLRQTTVVKPLNFFAIVLLAVLWVGCQKSDDSLINTKGANSPADTSADRSQPPLPNGPQAKLQTMKLYLGRMLGHGPTENLDAEIAQTETQEQTGLMYRTN